MKLLKQDMHGNERETSPEEAQGDPVDPRGRYAHSVHPDEMSKSGAMHQRQSPNKTARQHATDMHTATGLRPTSTVGPNDGENEQRGGIDDQDPAQVADQNLIRSDEGNQPLSSGPYVNAGIYQYGN